jgi:hypothetical protein
MSAPKSATPAERRRSGEHETLVSLGPTELRLQRYCANTNVGAVNVRDERRRTFQQHDRVAVSAALRDERLALHGFDELR